MQDCLAWRDLGKQPTNTKTRNLFVRRQIFVDFNILEARYTFFKQVKKNFLGCT